MPYVVTVALTVDIEDPDEAIAFVRAELAAKLTDWQTEKPAPLPRWQTTSVVKATKQDEHGFFAA